MAGRSERVLKICEISAALALVAWRLSRVVPWKDWLTLVALVWLVGAVLERPRVSVGTAFAVGLYLLGLYLSGQTSHAWATLGLAP